jgi:hypothetical protein
VNGRWMTLLPHLDLVDFTMYKYQPCEPVYSMCNGDVCAWFDAFWASGHDAVIFWSDKIEVIKCKPTIQVHIHRLSIMDAQYMLSCVSEWKLYYVI